MQMFYDNQTTIFIANNHVLHEHSKHVELTFTSFKKKIDTAYVHYKDQLGDSLPKPLARSPFSRLPSSLRESVKSVRECFISSSNLIWVFF